MLRKLCATAGVQVLFWSLCASPAWAAEDPGRQAFAAGVALLQDPDGARYDDALPLFQKAYELTKSWKVLGNLGLCYMKLERYGDAIQSYERYLREGGSEIDAQEQQQVTADLNTMRTQKVTLRIALLGAQAARMRDERRKATGGTISNTYSLSAATTLILAPGDHVFFVEGAGARREWSVRLEPASEVTHTFDLTRAATPRASSEPSSASRTPALIAGGTTLLLAAGTTVTGIMALGKRSDYHAINGKPGNDRTEIEDARDQASSMALISSVLFGATLVGAGVTTWLFVSPPGGTRQEPDVSALSLSPWLGLGTIGISAGGRL
jgi:hypothetical protein